MNPSLPPNTSAGRHVLESTAVGLGVLALLAAFWDHFFPGRLPGDLYDARFNQAILEHGFRWLKTLEGSFWDSFFFYPAKNVIAYSDSHLGTLPIYAPLRWGGLGRDAAFLWWFHVSCAASLASCHFALRRLDTPVLPALCGAFVFAFSMPVWAQINHAQLMPRFFIPLGFLCLLRLLEGRETRYWYGLLAAVIAQLYCGIYMGYFLALCLSATALPPLVRRLAAGRMGPGLLRVPVAHVIGSALLLSALLPLAIPYASAASEVGLRPWGEISTMLPRAISYLHAPDSLTWGGFLAAGNRLPMPHEHVLFVGVLPLCAVLAGVVQACSRPGDKGGARARILLAGMIMTALLTLYLGDLSPYRLATLLPGAGSVRAVSRVILVMLFPVAFVVGRALESVLRRLRGPAMARWAAGVLVLACCVADQRARLLTFPVEVSRAGVEQVKSAMARAGGDVFWVHVSDQAGDRFGIHLTAMLAAQELGVRIVNGYSGNCPPGYSWNLWMLGPESCEGLGEWIGSHPDVFSGRPPVVLGVPPCEPGKS